MSKGIQFRTKNNEKVYPYPFMPVGSIYLSVTSTNPSTYFGGTWTQLKNAFLFATNSTSGEKGTGSGTGKETGASSGSTGSTALSISQMPKHAHNVIAVNQSSAGYEAENGNGASFILNYNKGITYGVPTKGWNNPVLMNSTGGSEGHTHSLNSHKHSIPYIEVYVWRRTA